MLLLVLAEVRLQAGFTLGTEVSRTSAFPAWALFSRNLGLRALSRLVLVAAAVDAAPVAGRARRHPWALGPWWPCARSVSAASASFASAFTSALTTALADHGVELVELVVHDVVDLVLVVVGLDVAEVAVDEMDRRLVPPAVVEDRVHMRSDVVTKFRVGLIRPLLAPLEVLADFLGEALEQVSALLDVLNRVASSALKGLDVRIELEDAGKNILNAADADGVPDKRPVLRLSDPSALVDILNHEPPAVEAIAFFRVVEDFAGLSMQAEV